VLDDAMRPAPFGVIGELYIGGAGLARGYLRRPELTADRFVCDPFAREPDARLYRTGDLGRVLPSGIVECLGRTDQQVKVRGFRIETGEIESVINLCPMVKESAVIVREDTPGDNRLVAYVVARESRPEPSVLRDKLKAALPHYMMPAAFVFLEHLPLTRIGKVDRQALLRLEGSRHDGRIRSAPPQSAEEKCITAIWCEVLRIPDLGIHDNFFELGGHSLLAMQIVSRVRSSVGVHLPVSALFEGPTVAALAERVALLIWARDAVPRQSDVEDSSVEHGIV
jgi:acyl carrier protein